MTMKKYKILPQFGVKISEQVTVVGPKIMELPDSIAAKYPQCLELIEETIEEKQAPAKTKKEKAEK